MTLDLAKLAAHGRAFSAARPWEPEELTAMLTLEKERGLQRTVAADYVRNGVMTPKEYDKVVKANFTPKTLKEAEADMEIALKSNAKKAKSKKAK